MALEQTQNNLLVETEVWHHKDLYMIISKVNEMILMMLIVSMKLEWNELFDKFHKLLSKA